MNISKIELQQIGKRFGQQWLFKNFDATFVQGKSYAITGNNGSGKSTLLQLMYGYQSPTKGNIKALFDNQLECPKAKIHQYSAFVSPFLDLPDELTLSELLQFHFSFKPKTNEISIEEMIASLWLTESEHKKIKHFSSGMKQRVKLALAFYADVNVLFLDEPTSNLDAKGIAWYKETLQSLRANKLVLIASNQTFEYDFADEVIAISS